MQNKSTNNEVLDTMEFLLVCKVQDFHKAGYSEVTIDVLKSYLVEKKWKTIPGFIHEITNDILTMTYAEVIDYLKLRDVFYAEEESLHKIFSNLI